MNVAEELRVLHSQLVYGETTWNLAKAVYDLGQPMVESAGFRSPQGEADWNLVTEWVTKATGDNRTNPGEQALEKYREALLRITNRLVARAERYYVGDPNDDVMVPEHMMTPTFGQPSGLFDMPVARTLRFGGAKRKSQTAKFCRCIKDVRKTIRPRKGSTAEKAAIGVCVKSVLQKKGRTLKTFKCGRKARLVTQKRK